MEESGNSRWTWIRLVWLAPMSMGVVFLLVMVMVIVAGGFEPFLAIFAAILLIAGYVGRRFPRRAGPITVLAVLIILNLINVPAAADDLGHPESFLNFAIFGALLLVLSLIGIASAVAVLMSKSNMAASRFVYIGLAVVLLGVVISAIATLSFESDEAAAGDLHVVAEDAEFAPVALTGSGGVGIFIENKNPFRHTFSIEALDIEVNLPGGADQRIDISAPPGTYEFFCAVPGHDMTGTLTMSG